MVSGAGGRRGAVRAGPGRAGADGAASQMSGDKGISAFPESDNLFRWIGTIDGAAGTVRPRTAPHDAPPPSPPVPPPR